MFYHWEHLTEQEQDQVAQGIMKGEAFGGPYHVALSPTDRCDFDCFFCRTIDRSAELPWPTLKRTIEQGVEMGLKGLSLLGGGEPLIYRHLGDLLDLMANHSLRIYDLTTNGTPLTRDLARTFNQLGIRWLTVSLNDPDPTEHEKICGTSRALFDKVMEGIENSIQARDAENSTCEVRVQVFLWKGNFRRILEMIASVLEHRPDYVFVNTIDELHDELRMNEMERQECKELIREASRRWGPVLQFCFLREGLQRFAEEEQAKFAPRAIYLEDMCQTSHRVEYCYIGWVAPVIMASGRAFPCIHLTRDAKKSVGHIGEQSLRSIWYGKRMNRFRREMRHLLLTNADRDLLPRHTCFTEDLCLERAHCPLNFYLCSREFYHRIDRWADEGIRAAYKRRQRAKAHVRRIGQVFTGIRGRHRSKTEQNPRKPVSNPLEPGRHDPPWIHR